MVGKGGTRENSLPPPTFAAGGSCRLGLGPWDCRNTILRPPVVVAVSAFSPGENLRRPPRYFFHAETSMEAIDRLPIATERFVEADG